MTPTDAAHPQHWGDAAIFSFARPMSRQGGQCARIVSRGQAPVEILGYPGATTALRELQPADESGCSPLWALAASEATGRSGFRHRTRNGYIETRRQAIWSGQWSAPLSQGPDIRMGEGPSSMNSGESGADRIRRHVRVQYIDPARRNGRNTVTMRNFTKVAAEFHAK